MSDLRIGTVSFFNALPLTEGLEGLVSDVPSRLARRFAAGEVDVALLPVLESLRLPDCPVVPEGVIASPGPVDSVLLFSRCEPRDAEQVSLDPGSRTSNGLLRILFADMLGGTPEFTLPRSLDGPHREDAYLLIGDAALREPREGLEILDLASAWRELCDLPFCFAVWVARDEAVAARAAPLLREARKRGLPARGRLARDWSARMGLPAEYLELYLTERITYEMGEGEKLAIARFKELLEKHGLL